MLKSQNLFALTTQLPRCFTPENTVETTFFFSIHPLYLTRDDVECQLKVIFNSIKSLYYVDCCVIMTLKVFMNVRITKAVNSAYTTRVCCNNNNVEFLVIRIYILVRSTQAGGEHSTSDFFFCVYCVQQTFFFFVKNIIKVPVNKTKTTEKST